MSKRSSNSTQISLSNEEEMVYNTLELKFIFTMWFNSSDCLWMQQSSTNFFLKYKKSVH